MRNVNFECKSSMDMKAKVKTIIVFLMFALLIGFLFLKSDEHKELLFPVILLMVVYLIALIVGIIKIPVSYKVVNNHLLIIGRFSQISINIQDIRNMRVFDAKDRKGLFRIVGAEGVLGNIGYYASIKNGRMLVLASRDSNWTIIHKKDNQKMVISPDDLGLINMVNELIDHRIV